jgi:phenylalanyl-tRNA synthetase beta chain
MKITHQWLQKFGNVEKNPEEMEKKLTDLGLEVEGIEPTLAEFDQVYVGKILNIEKHPDADKLNICSVDVGQESPLSIVCGAPNVQVDKMVPVALMGAQLPFGKLKPKKIRGIASEGMICSEEELGFAEESEGIWLLDNKYSVGKLFRDYFDNDFVYELSVGPNRPDCLGMKGILRDLELTGESSNSLNEKSIPEKKPMEDFKIEIESPKHCQRYVGALIKNVKIDESPEWLKNALNKIGLRPINNIVDLTNYLMMLYGHPMHAFDADKLEGNKIVVRHAKDGEKLITLDDVERTFNSEDLMICDAEKPVAIAGVMGGANSEISDSTTNLLLEIAMFDTMCIRKTSKRQKLHTDASHRFERGMDFEFPPILLNHALKMIQELAGGEFCGWQDAYPTPYKPEPIILKHNLVKRVLGITLDRETLLGYLQKLECQVVDSNEEQTTVLAPSFRPDLERPIDLVEEFARIYGFDNIPFEAPKISLDLIKDTPDEKLCNDIRTLLSSMGFNECVTYSFAKEDYEHKSIPLQNPMSEEMGNLRTNIKDKLIEVAIHNLKKQNSRLSLFEMGKVFFKDGLSEELRLSVLLCNSQETNWKNKAQHSDLFQMKGVVETLSTKLRAPFQISDCREDHQYINKNECLTIMFRGKPAGFIGHVEPKLLKKEKIFLPMVVMELNLSALLGMKHKPTKFKEIPQYPGSERQLALLTPKSVTAEQILDRVRKQKINFLEDYEIFDYYTGKGIPEGKKSIGVSFFFRAKDKTLSEEELNQAMTKILNDLDKQLGITLRS